MSSSVTIVIATHIACQMPKDDIYMPLYVGAENSSDESDKLASLGYQKDNDGDNISALNPYLGTQTGLYWAWKHLNSDYIGLVHYRRFFRGRSRKKNDFMGSILTGSELRPLLDNYSVFVPKKRRYFIETLYSHYAHTMDGHQLDAARDVIASLAPQYIDAYNKVMGRTWGYMFNMMILRRDLMDSYCSWLFPILMELLKRLDTSSMTTFEKRFGGRISERLFNVWLEYQLSCGNVTKNRLKELPYIEFVKWGAKIRAFLMAKLFHHKYKASF